MESHKEHKGSKDRKGCRDQESYQNFYEFCSNSLQQPHCSYTNPEIIRNLMIPEEDIRIPKSRAGFSLAEANQFIEAICSLKEEAKNLDWLLDIDFGFSHNQLSYQRMPPAFYDPYRNLIMSALQPDRIHPCFLRCDEAFQYQVLYFCSKRQRISNTQYQYY